MNWIQYKSFENPENFTLKLTFFLQYFLYLLADCYIYRLKSFFDAIVSKKQN